MKVAAYIRVSTIEQATHGLSLIAQKHLLETYASEHEMEIVEVYADEGVSASKALEKRAGIVRLIEDAEAGRFSCVIFKDVTRWSRNSAQYYKVQERLDRAGVSWVAVEQPYLETVTPTGRFQVSVMLGTSQLESDQTGARIKFVQDSEVARGNYPFPAHCAPLGYTTQKIGGVNKLIPSVDREIVVSVFDEFLKCGNLTQVGKALGRSAGNMARTIRNRIYIGEFRGIENFCEPIVSRDVFNRAQELMRHHSYTPKKHAGEYIFSGLCRCAKCGGRMNGLCPDDKYYMYQCRGGCRNTITQRVLEAKVIAQVEPELNQYRLTLVQRKDEIAQAKKLRSRFESKIERLKDLYVDGLISRTEFDKRRKEYTEAIAEIETPPSPDLPTDWLELYDRLSPEQKNVLWKTTIDHIVVDHDRVHLVFESAKVLAERMSMIKTDMPL